MSYQPAKNIVLIGMRATGKTAIGRVLAEYLGWQFIDVDREIENGEGVTITELVATHDWEHFRDLESKYVARAAAEEHAVIATGGGVVLRPENIEILRRDGVVVLLTAPLAELATRLQNNPHRPSLTGADPAAELAKIWADRREIYEQAADTVVPLTPGGGNKKSDLIRKSKQTLRAVREFLGE